MELLTTFIIGSTVLLLVLLYKHLTRYYGSLETLGIPVIPPFLCFGSPPYDLHNLQAEQEDEATYKKLKSLTWGFYWGSQPFVVTMDPVWMKEIFVKQFTSFSEREGGFNMEDKYLSLDIAGGEKWKSERKLLSPTFTAGKIKMMIKSIVNLTDTLVEHVDNNIKNKEKGDVVDMRSIFHAYSMDVIGECAFGASFGCLGKDKINREHTMFEYGLGVFTNLSVTSAFEGYFFHLYFMFPSLYTIMPDFPKDVYDFIIKTTKNLIKERDEKEMEDQGDFIDRLRFMTKKIRASEKKEHEGLNEDMVAAQGIVFLAAGFETTSSTMSLLLYNLAKHPLVQEKVYAEIASVLENNEEDAIDHDTIAEMPYLEACLYETLRLYPIVIRNQRYCNKDSLIDGKLIKKGTSIIVPTWAMHRNPELYGEDASEFKPERFIEEEGGVKVAEKFSDLTFQAFGGGPRICIGMRFAMTEMKLAMTKLLSTFSFEDEPGVTKLDIQKGGYFLLSYPEMKIKIKRRDADSKKEE